jgi:uncharacterized surface anchored protein
MPTATNTTFTFTKDPAKIPQSVILVVRDYVTEEVIPGASVTVTGPNGAIYSGTTDEHGLFDLGTVPAGAYSLVATASGYQNSGEDFLANDTFTV